VNLTDVIVLASAELLRLQLPFDPVVQVWPPDPADQVPDTETPATEPAAPVTWMVTVAAHDLRPAFVVAESESTHIVWSAGGELTLTPLLVDAVAPPLSVTVSVTVYEPPLAYVWAGLATVAVASSPKAQELDAIVPSGSLEVLVNVQVRSMQLLVNDAVGG